MEASKRSFRERLIQKAFLISDKQAKTALTFIFGLEAQEKINKEEDTTNQEELSSKK